jgi:aspartate/methionine/tyrosine aminotransferase
LARKALLVKEQLADRSKAIIQGNLKLCGEFFAKFPDHFTWRRPRAGSVAFVELNLAEIGFDSATTYCHHLAQNHGIVLLPGKCLGFDDSFVRFGLGRVSFESALDAYAAVVSASLEVSP